MRKKIISFMLAVAMLISLSACSYGSVEKNECEDLIDNLETACNNADISGILDCINPDKSAALKAVVNAISDGSDKVINTVFDFLGISVTSEDSSDETIDTIFVEPTEYDLEDESGTIACTLSVKAEDTTIEKQVVFKVVKKNESWYIDGVSSAK